MNNWPLVDGVVWGGYPVFTDADSLEKNHPWNWVLRAYILDPLLVPLLLCICSWAAISSFPAQTTWRHVSPDIAYFPSGIVSQINLPPWLLALIFYHCKGKVTNKPGLSDLKSFSPLPPLCWDQRYICLVSSYLLSPIKCAYS